MTEVDSLSGFHESGSFTELASTTVVDEFSELQLTAGGDAGARRRPWFLFRWRR